MKLETNIQNPHANSLLANYIYSNRDYRGMSVFISFCGMEMEEAFAQLLPCG